VVFIEIQKQAGFAELCTGSLVTPSLVLTAGHCLDESVGTPIRSITVYAGAHSWSELSRRSSELKK
jgi:V8-like Glu-specific endopeptidase